MSVLLKENLLLGTDRRKIDMASLPSYLASFMKVGAADEEQLLSALTYNYYYEKQGQLPRTIQLDHEPLTIIENRPIINNVTAQLLSEILAEDHLLKRDLLKNFIRGVREKQLIVDGNGVLDLIEEGKRLSTEDRKIIIDIIGNKGAYILKSYPIDGYKDFAFAQKSVLDASKVDILTEFSKAGRDARIEILTANWEQFSIREKILVTVFVCSDIHDDYLEFFREIYYRDFAGKASAKSFVRQLKRLVVHILLALREEKLVTQLQDQLGQYVERKKAGFLSKIIASQQVNLNIPIIEDIFWNGPYLNAFLGLEEKNSNIAKFDYDTLFRWSNMVEIVPVDLLAEILGLSTGKTITYLCSDEQFTSKIKGEKTQILTQALVDNALLSRDSDLIGILATKIKTKEMDELIPYMEQDVFERFFLRYRHVTNLDLLAAREDAQENMWSLSFSKNMVSELLKICKSGSFRPHQKFGVTMARFFHPKAYDHLITVSKGFASEQWFDTWRNHVVVTIQKSLRIRKALLQISA